jgi:rRNA processing protein Gar1
MIMSMYLQAGAGENIHRFAETLYKVNKVKDIPVSEIIGTFNDVYIYVKSHDTPETLVKQYYDKMDAISAIEKEPIYKSTYRENHHP